MVVSERNPAVVFQPSVSLVWIPCLGALLKRQAPLSEGSMEIQAVCSQSLGNAGCASEQSFERLAVARPMTVGHSSQSSFAWE